MADTINYRFRMRRALAATWASLNDVLLEGEYGYEKDTGKVKIGDGTTPWNSLDYFAGSPGLTISDTAPASPEAGAEWVDATSGVRYSYYDDDDSQQWVEFGPEMPLYILPKYAEGTSFPGSPATNDKFYRTDLNLLCYYDGTQWLTCEVYVLNSSWPPQTINANTRVAEMTPRDDMWIVEVCFSLRVNAGTNNGSNFWNITLYKTTPSEVSTAVVSTNTASVAVGVAKTVTISVGAALGAGYSNINLWCAKTGAPSGLGSAHAAIYYRRIVT